MARIVLNISDPGLKLTLEVMLQAEGHAVVADQSEVTIADTPASALAAAESSQALLLTPASGVAEAVNIMRQGVYGYILLPLQPGEAGIMAARAAQAKDVNDETPENLMPLAQAEKAHIENVLRACKGNQAKAAQLLGIGRNTLWRKLKAWNNRPSA